jgi:hypothetical protein
MQYVFAALILVHGLIHLLGFAHAIGWTIPLQQSLGVPAGVLWLATAVLFFVTSVMVAKGQSLWWVPMLPALASSQILIVTVWTAAKFGTIPNVVILLPLVVTLLDYRSGGFRRSYEKEVEQRRSIPAASGLISNADLRHLPPAVRRYLENTGSVGRARVDSFRVRMRGEIRRSPTSRWMRFEADQHGFIPDRARLFLLRAWQLGVPFQAYHRYVGSSATMEVELLSLFKIVDARGPEMDQSETVTMFNDMCMLAPASLVARDIQWREIDPLKVHASFTNAGHTISAVLSFDESGNLRNFESDDRYLSADGRKYERYRWSTPMSDYRDFGGRKVASRGEASWRLPEGDFVYAKIEIVGIEYNVRSR